jgi:hypothetical protein
MSDSISVTYDVIHIHYHGDGLDVIQLINDLQFYQSYTS